MLRITVELMPYGQDDGTKVIGLGFIANDGKGDKNTANYDVAFLTEEGTRIEGKVKNFVRDEGFWVLLQKALEAAND